MRSLFHGKPLTLVQCLLLGALLYCASILLLEWLFSYRSHSRPRWQIHPTFDISRDRKRIVFSSPDTGRFDLYLADLGSGKVERLTQTPDYEMAPTFSPDGKSIAYSSGIARNRADHIFVRSLVTGEVQQLTNDDSGDTLPTFSHDGSRIVFLRGHALGGGAMLAYHWRDWGVCTMKADGTQLNCSPNRDGVATHDVYEVPFRHTFSVNGGTIVQSHPMSNMTTEAKRKIIRKIKKNEPIDIVQSADKKYVFFFDAKHNLWQIGVDGKNYRQLAASSLFTDLIY